MRCDRPACPECLRDASVGYQCVECVNEGRKQVRQATTIAGGRPQAKPVVMPVLVALNLGLFLVTAAQAGSVLRNDRSDVFFELVTFPLAIAELNEWWRLLTGGFLHYGLIHVAVNMFALWMLGREIEQRLGWPRFLLVYLVSLLGGSVAVYFFDDPRVGLAGASGAVWGLIGSLVVLIIRMRLSLQPVIGLILINVFISFLPGVSWLGHFGGGLVGAAVTAALVYAPRERRTVVQTAGVAGVLLVLGVLIALRTPQILDLNLLS